MLFYVEINYTRSVNKMNKKLKKRIMIVVCIVSILITSVSSLVAFGENKVKADDYETICIKKFQKYLNNNFNAGLVVDGVYGPKSKKAAVKALQRLYNEVYNTNLKVDGIYGNNTQDAINKHPIKRGTRNKIVKFFQVAYSYCWHSLAENDCGELAVDGIFGSQTAKAVKTIYEYEPGYYISYDMLPTEIHATTWGLLVLWISVG